MSTEELAIIASRDWGICPKGDKEMAALLIGHIWESEREVNRLRVENHRLKEGLARSLEELKVYATAYLKDRRSEVREG